MQSFEFHRRVNVNDQGRDFVVGDIHGDLCKLKNALGKVGFDDTVDRLFSVGDLIDRGPKNLETLAWYFEKNWFYAIRGNHEQMVLDACQPTETHEQERYRQAKQQFHYENGGEWFWQLSEAEQSLIAEKLKTLPYAMTIQTVNHSVGIVHAEVPKHYTNWESYLRELECDAHVQHESLWSRHFIYEAFPGLKDSDPFGAETMLPSLTVTGVEAVIHGHTGVPKALQFGNRYWIDTGYLRGDLTLVELTQPLVMHV